MHQVDPMKAHGAWIFLFASVAAGALVGSQRGVVPAMLVGTAFAGAYLVVAALAVGVTRKKLRQVLTGVGAAALAAVVGWWMEVELQFLLLAAVALVLAVSSMVLAKTRGFLSPLAIATGVAALGMSAPAAAVAGGASWMRGALLFALLVPFFSWRSLRIAAPLAANPAWDTVALKAQGLREAAIAALWTIAVVVGLHVF